MNRFHTIESGLEILSLEYGFKYVTVRSCAKRLQLDEESVLDRASAYGMPARKLANIVPTVCDDTEKDTMLISDEIACLLLADLLIERYR